MALSLQEALASVPDPRSRHGVRFPLHACLCLAVLGILAGRQSLAAILQLHEDFGDGLPLALGFRHARFPCRSALAQLLGRIDAGALEAVLSAWAASRLAPGQADVLAIDGKALRGSRDGLVPGHHLLAAYAP